MEQTPEKAKNGLTWMQGPDQLAWLWVPPPQKPLDQPRRESDTNFIKLFLFVADTVGKISSTVCPRQVFTAESKAYQDSLL